MKKISIIITIYGVEKYIERCCISIFQQTYQDFELICVNDCSKDNSENVLLDVIARYKDTGIATTVIRHETNKGISAARETGLAAATGEYILYIDSDDYIAPNMLALLAEKAMATDADVVYCDYAEVKNGREMVVSQTLPTTDSCSVAAAMLRQEIVWAPWNKLFRRFVATQFDIHWPIGINIGEDMVVMTKLICHANKIEYVNEALYYYNRDNVNSYLNAWNANSCYQNTRAVQAVHEFLAINFKELTLLDALVQTKLMARYQMLYAFDKNLLQMAVDTFPETNGEVFRYAHTSLYWKIALYLVVNKSLFSSAALKAIWFFKRSRRYFRV